MSEQVFDVDLRVTVRVSVRDTRVIDRPVNNVEGWRDALYDLRTRDQVLHHLAYNCAVNGYNNGLLLDGWADLPVEAVGMTVRDADLEDVSEVAHA